MRRVVSGGVLLSLGLFAAHAALEAWMETRAVFALEEAGRRLPEGARLSWQRLDARPLWLSVAVEGVRLELPASAPVRTLEAGMVELAQVGSLAELGRSASARAQAVVVQLAQERGTLRIGAIEGARVDIEALTAALAAEAPQEALARSTLGPLTLEDLHFEGPDVRADAARLVIARFAQERLEGFTLERLAVRTTPDERLALESLALDLLDLRDFDPELVARAAEDPSALFAALDRLRLSGVRLARLALESSDGRMTLAGFELAHLGDGRLERFRLEDLAIKESDGRFGVALVELAHVDWSRVRFERLVRAGELLGDTLVRVMQETGAESERASEDAVAAEAEPAPAGEDGAEDEELAHSFAALEFAAELGRFAVGPVRLEELEAFDSQGSGVALARLRWDGLVANRLGAIELAGLRIRNEDGSELDLARFEQSAVTMMPPDFATRLEAAPRTQEGLQALQAELARLMWDSRTLLAGFTFRKDDRIGFGFERLALRLDQQASNKRGEFHLTDLVLDPEVLEVEELQAALAIAGVDRLRMGLRLLSSYDEATLDFALDPLELDALGLFGLRMSLLGKLGADPAVDPVTASTDAKLIRAELRLLDRGLVDRRIEAMAREAGKKRADFVKQLIRDLRAEEPLRSLLDQKRTSELEKFLLKPRVLVVRLAPAQPVSFMAAFLGMLATPGQAAKTLGLAIEARED